MKISNQFFTFSHVVCIGEMNRIEKSEFRKATKYFVEAFRKFYKCEPSFKFRWRFVEVSRTILIISTKSAFNGIDMREKLISTFANAKVLKHENPIFFLISIWWFHIFYKSRRSCQLISIPHVMKNLWIARVISNVHNSNFNIHVASPLSFWLIHVHIIRW